MICLDVCVNHLDHPVSRETWQCSMNCVNAVQISQDVKEMVFLKSSSCQVGGGGAPAPPPVKVEPVEGGKEEKGNDQHPTAAQVVAQSKQEQCKDFQNMYRLQRM